MHGPTARPLPLPYLQIINPLEGFVGAEDQASNKPADMFKSFRTTKDLSKTFHPLGQDLGHPNNRQHGSTLSFSISFFLSSSIHPFFPITFQVVYHIYAIRTQKRDALMSALAAVGIHCGVYYPTPLHLQEAYRSLGLRKGSYPVTEKCAEELLSLPMFPELTEEQIERVVLE